MLRGLFSPRRNTGTDEILGRIFCLTRKLNVIPLDDDFRLHPRRFLSWFLVMLLDIALNLTFYTQRHHEGTKSYLLLTETLLTLWAVVVSSTWLLLRRSDLYAVRTGLHNLENVLNSAGLEMEWEVRLFNVDSVFISIMVVVCSAVCPAGIISIFNIMLVNTIILCFVETSCFMRQLFDTVSQIQDTNCLLACIDSINAIFNKLMNCYGMVTFVIISSMFTRLLCNLFIQFTQPFDEINVVWFCFAIYPIFLILKGSFLSLSKVEELNNVMYRKALANSMDENLEFYLTAQRDVEFSSFGFFNLDNTLVSSMIGTAITYLVILLQYNVRG